MIEKNQNDDEETQKREKGILVRLTQSEKKEIHKFAKKTHLTDAEFCRIAIWDKIRHLKNPDRDKALRIYDMPDDLKNLANRMDRIEISLDKIADIILKY